MKIKNVPGEFYFRALEQTTSIGGDLLPGWLLTPSFFRTREEAAEYCRGRKFIWPAEEIEPNTIYVPSDAELKQDTEDNT